MAKKRGFFEKMRMKNTKNEKNSCGWSCCCNSKGIGFWGFGSALAMAMSYTDNYSIAWAILHGVFSWFYIIYRALGYG